jgi:hypothetical protein
MGRRCGHVFIFDEDTTETICCLCGKLRVPHPKADTTMDERLEKQSTATDTSASTKAVQGSDAGSSQQLPGVLDALQLDDSDSDSAASLSRERRRELAVENEFVFEAFERFRSLGRRTDSSELTEETVARVTAAQNADLDEMFSRLERSIRQSSHAAVAYRGLQARLAHLEREADFNQTLVGRERRHRAPKRKNMEAIRERIEKEMRQALAAMYTFCEAPVADAPEYEIMPPMGNISRKLIHQLAEACRTRSQSSGNPRCATILRTPQTRWCGEERALRLYSECLEEAMLKRAGLYRTPRPNRRERPQGPTTSSATEQRAKEQGRRRHQKNVRGTVRTEHGRAQLQQTTLSVQPVEAANRGHEMLRRIGWQPGQVLGTENARERALREPVAATLRAPRRGLGASTPPPSRYAPSWKASATTSASKESGVEQ